jgi:hypothetical protein
MFQWNLSLICIFSIEKSDKREVILKAVTIRIKNQSCPFVDLIETPSQNLVSNSRWYETGNLYDVKPWRLGLKINLIKTLIQYGVTGDEI